MANGKPWTEADTATLRRMNAVGYTDGEIAAVTGHNPRTVQRQRAAHQLPICKRIDWLTRSARDMVVRRGRRQPCAQLHSA